MFDDKGDAIYGTGFVAALLSLIITLVKLYVKHNSANVQPKMPKPNHYSSPRPVNSTSAKQSYFFGAAQGHIHQGSSLPVRERQSKAFDIIRVNSLPIEGSVPVQYTSSAIPMPPALSSMPEPSQRAPLVTVINEVQDYKSLAWCGCPVGNCIL